MGVLDFIFGGKDGLKMSTKEVECQKIMEQLWCMQYAKHIVAERYGSLMANCEFKTYVQGNEKKGDNYYLFNVSPNPNQTATEFWKQVVNKLVNNLECLIVIMDNGNWYVADSFTKGEYQLAETNFKDVVVDVYGDGTVAPYQLTGTFSGDKCVYIKYANKNANVLMENMTNLYRTLINNVMDTGSSKLKYALTIDSTAMNGVDIDINEEVQRLINSDFESLVSGKNAIIPMFNGFKLDVLNPNNNNAQNSTTASQNVNSMFEDILVNVGLSYNVPSSVMKGTYEENDFDDFLTFGLDAMCVLIEEAINRKYYKKRAYQQGTRVHLDTKKVKHFDILTVQNAINKLISSGVYSINEIRELLDEKPIDKKLGDVHWVTRNYAVIGDYIQEQSNFTGNDKKTHPEQYE